MTLLNIPAFSGLNVMVAPQRLREDEAMVAVGCDFRSLDLRPFKADNPTSQGTPNTASLAGGASIFQFDASHWLGTLGDKSFARNPTFYSDATIGQRVFITDNAAPAGTEWDWIREVTTADLVSTGYTDSYAMSGVAKRLGVPRPAATTKLDYDPKSGRVTRMERFTDDNTKITVSAALDSTVNSQDALKVADKILLDVPGIGAGQFTVTKKDDYDPWALTLGNTKLSYVQCNAVKKENSTEVSFKKTNHGFSGGEQIILNARANTPGSYITDKLPTGVFQNLYTVVWVSVDEFKLAYGADSAELVLIQATENAGTVPLKYALVAQADDVIADAWLTSQVLVITDGLQQQVSFRGLASTDVVSTWESAVDTLMERSYVLTFVNVHGDESEPSDPTQSILVAQGDPVTFSSLPTEAAAYADYLSGSDVPTLAKYSTLKELRIYRTDATGTFRLLTTGVDEDRTLTWPLASGFTFVDTYTDSELGEPLATAGWAIPPKDINGVLTTPGGVLMGYKGRGVVGSVPYAPYAFPLANRVAFDYEVMGLVATSSGAVVVTQGMPSLVIGDDPGTWSVQKLEYPYGCVSRRSIVDMGEVAIYASADGLIGVAGATVEILTANTLTRAQWNSLYSPQNIFAAHVEGRYYGVTTVSGTVKAFMFDPRTRTFIDLTVDQANAPLALYTRLDTDTLLILKEDGYVHEWNRGTDWTPYTWRSKFFQMTRPDILGCAQILSPAQIANYDVTMRLIAWDGEAMYTVAVFSNLTGSEFDNLGPAAFTTWENGARRYAFNKNINPFRLPVPNNRYTVYQVELEGTLPIGQVSLASVIDELKGV